MRKIIVYIMIVTFISCQSNKQEDKMLPLLDNYEYVHFIPDSTATAEQLVLKYKIAELMVSHLKNEDGLFKFNLTKEEMIAKGIPEPYYNVILNNITEMNIFQKSNVVKNVDSLILQVKSKIPESQIFLSFPDLIKKDSFKENMTMRIVNLSNDTIYFGTRYIVEDFSYKTNSWSELKFDGIFLFNDLGIFLQPDQVFDFDIHFYPKLYSYPTGKYRIVKKFKTKKGEIELNKEFLIK